MNPFLKRSFLAIILLMMALLAFAQSETDIAAYRLAILSCANQERQQAGLKTLTVDPTLEGIAQEWANRLQQKGKLEHRDRSDLIDFLKKYGWRSMNENLHGSPLAITPKGCIESWMKSRVHRQNLLDERMILVGFGIAPSSDGNVYVVMNAATR